jgi:Fe-S cluster assembly protein SufD
VSALFRLDFRDVSTFPTRRDEAWRWSDVRRALPQPVSTAPELAPPFPPGPLAGLADAETVFANGQLSGGAPLVRLRLEGGVHHLRFISAADGAGWQSGADIVVPAGAHATLIETHEGQGGYAASAVVSLTLGEGAALERIVVLDEPTDAVSLTATTVALAKDARFAQTVVATGGRLQRYETHLTHPGEGATVRMDGLYLLDGQRHADLTSVVLHEGGGATSQVCKGVVTDRARAAFQGRIEVRPGADGTDARMRHDALLLSDTAEVDAKPELEIYADDVACAHGNTVGALDDDSLFYIRSRGVPEADARALLIQAFLGEAVERIAHEGAREAVADFVARRLEALA